MKTYKKWKMNRMKLMRDRKSRDHLMALNYAEIAHYKVL